MQMDDKSYRRVMVNVVGCTDCDIRMRICNRDNWRTASNETVSGWRFFGNDEMKEKVYGWNLLWWTHVTTALLHQPPENQGEYLNVMFHHFVVT
jgi:hypothetical protein